MRQRFGRAGTLVVSAALALAGCTTLVEELPQAPSGPSPTPIPVVVIPVPVPTAPPPTTPPAPNPTPAPNNPGPSPSNSPGPAPTPTPAPPQTQACSLPPGSGSGVNCPKTGANFLGEVDAAINRVVQSQPGNFDLSDQRGNGGYRIRNIDAFLQGVVVQLRAMGLCAIVDAGGEVAVKNNNSFSDQYDLILSSGHIFRGEGSYAATCRPAWF